MMAEHEYLVGEERDVYMEDFSSLVLATVHGVVDLADRYNIDRDNAMEHFATLFKAMQEVSTFQNFGNEECADMRGSDVE